MTAILNQDDVNHAMLHHGVGMAIKNYVTMKDTSAQTYRQSPHRGSYQHLPLQL